MFIAMTIFPILAFIILLAAGKTRVNQYSNRKSEPAAAKESEDETEA
jgi:hypothetical protein